MIHNMGLQIKIMFNFLGTWTAAEIIHLKVRDFSSFELPLYMCGFRHFNKYRKLAGAELFQAHSMLGLAKLVYRVQK